MGLNIGFVSTRLAGTDGVSLEAGKWADVFEAGGHTCYWFAGKLDRDLKNCFTVPEAHFQDERNRWLNERIFGKNGREPAVTRTIHELRSFLKSRLRAFIRRFDIHLLIAENVLTIPLHVPLGLALTETIAETQIPTISHNHDFYWERVRFSVNAVGDYLRMAFPPNLPNIRHVVINSEAQELLAHRTGISAAIIPNVLDFENPPMVNEEKSVEFRNAIGLGSGNRMILQPTRIVQRKGIEHAIELVKELSDAKNVLVVSHEAGDEGFEYADWLSAYAGEHDVDLRVISTRVTDPWAQQGENFSGYSLWDIYPFADFITYPSLYEGFGNAFLEAIYFKKPLLINRYATFVRDIEPLGFDLAVMDGYLSKKTVESVKSILNSPERKEQMVSTNYRIASHHYSYSVFRHQVNAILNGFFGAAVHPLTAASGGSSEKEQGTVRSSPALFGHVNCRNCPVQAATVPGAASP